ncbi:MAG: S1 RNA-binding domain-containing protein [bacterium]
MFDEKRQVTLPNKRYKRILPTTNNFDQWECFAQGHRRGERILGEIMRIEKDMGLFISFGDGVFGIAHLSDLDWVLSSEDAITRYFIGDYVETVILAIDPELQRITLGIKQLKPDPCPGDAGDPPRNPPDPGSLSPLALAPPFFRAI